MQQINLERNGPVIGVLDVAYPTCVGTDSNTPHVDALGVIAIGVAAWKPAERDARPCSRGCGCRTSSVELFGQTATRHHRHGRGWR